VTSQVVERPSREGPDALKTRGGPPVTLAELRDGWWMRNSDRTAHRLKFEELEGGAFVSVCGLSDRHWRTVAATGELCCGACGHLTPTI